MTRIVARLDAAYQMKFKNDWTRDAKGRFCGGYHLMGYAALTAFLEGNAKNGATLLMEQRHVKLAQAKIDELRKSPCWTLDEQSTAVMVSVLSDMMTAAVWEDRWCFAEREKAIAELSAVKDCRDT